MTFLPDRRMQVPLSYLPVHFKVFSSKKKANTALGFAAEVNRKVKQTTLNPSSFIIIRPVQTKGHFYIGSMQNHCVCGKFFLSAWLFRLLDFVSASRSIFLNYVFDILNLCVEFRCVWVYVNVCSVSIHFGSDLDTP